MSAFLTPSSTVKNNTLAFISLGREHIPTILHAPSTEDSKGPQKEESITNTRFGSFPHSTIVNLPWGSQVLASNVGAVERRRGKKRKRESLTVGAQILDQDEEPLTFEAAPSGFAHILPPTPENWTSSLPHRTQVVYAPDYTFILQRLCARPGTRLIEAGAGSGSFTHAAARAVFNGYPSASKIVGEFGKVFSYEYHEPRHHALTKEIRSHGLEEVVQITHRDVYADGFCLSEEDSPNVTAVFLDLPSPWLALPHLTRSVSPSPLNPNAPIHICCFSPCVEQVTRTASTLRSLGYVSVTLFTIQQKQHVVRRERVGLFDDGSRGSIVFPGSVEEALDRLKMLEQRNMAFAQRRKEKLQDMISKREQGDKPEGTKTPDFPSDDEPPPKDGPGSRAERMEKIAEESKSRKTFLEGKVVHKTELELKTHTSFLLFAILPRAWTKEDEEICSRETENDQ